MDDRRGRKEAEHRGIAVAATLNVLEAAAKRGLLDLPNAISLLRETNFHVAESIIQQALIDDSRRKGST
jgi:predicted nucleic acid-binding protein